MRDRPKREGELWEAMGEVGFASGLSRESAPGLDAGRLPDGSFLAGHPYLSFLHRLEKPGRYTGGEVHSIGRERDEARISIALAFPDAYEIGMSHLGFRILYSHLNAIDGVRAERVYAPWFDLESELRRRRLPLVSLETWTPLCRFDCVGFSFQYELTYTNVLAMLDLGGIPIHASDRTEEDPLVMAGGPVAFQPEPMAPFIDAYLIGDGEVFFHRTVEEWRRLKEEGASRRERLAGIAGMDGIYVPSLYRTALDERTSLEVVTGPLQEGIPERISRAHLADINEVPFPADSPVPNTEIVFDRASVEIARGCTEGCRFCQAGMIYRPVRERDPQGIRKAVRESVRCGGFDEVSLTSLSTADYSAIQPLVKRIMGELKEENVALSVSSLRAYGLSEEMLDDIASVRNTSLTFAPEAGTQRMRDVVNKNIFEEDIVKTAHRVFSRGWRKLKLYFMIGLPTEADEDVRGIAEMGRELLGIGEEYLPKRRLEVTLSVSSHVPKPFTPFQWAAQDSLAEIERKQQILREATRVRGLRFRWHDPHTSHLEGILGRGDRPIAAVIESAWRKGCRFEPGGTGCASISGWRPSRSAASIAASI
ncbi:MAG: TIGR03960 family B12-binding radical SAM protein [Planctomycetota bacterium]